METLTASQWHTLALEPRTALYTSIAVACNLQLQASEKYGEGKERRERC
jgi:hypothetical protein